MKMIDLYAAPGVFPIGSESQLGERIALAVLRAEGWVNPGPAALIHTALYLHRLEPDAADTAPLVRVQIRRPAGCFSADAWAALVVEITAIVLQLSADPAQSARTQVDWIESSADELVQDAD